MLDLDSEKKFSRFRGLNIPRVWFAAPSSTIGHWHVLITLNYDITPLQHAKASIAYGSDPKREAANLDRAAKGAEFPIALFRQDTPKGWRKPDLSCHCPWMIPNKKTGKLEKLHACVCIRRLRGHQYQAALKTNPNRISQKHLHEMIAL